MISNTINSVPIAAIMGLGAPELLIILGVVGFCLVLCLIPAVLAFILLNRVPAEFRKQEPGLAFLLIIPVFNFIWNFFIFPKISESWQAYYASRNNDTKVDCGNSLAKWYCITSVCAIIPFIGFLAGVAALILFIMFIAKAFALKTE